jgi:thiol-disulfide isomerase/thioredoxin
MTFYKILNRKFQTVFFFICLTSILGVLYYLFNNSSKGEKAPDFTTELVNGNNYSLSNSKGNYVILYFWGSWCGPCLRNAPKLVQLDEKYKSITFVLESKLDIITIALEKKGEKWKKVVDKFGFKWEYQIVQYHNLVLSSSIANNYGVFNIPSTFLINPTGNIVLSKTSFLEIEQYLDKIIFKP